MEAYFAYGPAYFYFFAPITLAVTLAVINGVYRAKRRRPMKPGRTAVLILVVANALFVLDSSLRGSPFGTIESWLALWAFAFLPSSFIFALVTEAWVGNLRDKAIQR